MRVLLRVLTLAVTLSLFGCGIADRNRVRSSVPGARIVVLSLLGDSFEADYIGITVFDNFHQQYHDGDWQLDRAISVLATKSLASAGIVQVVDADVEKYRSIALQDENFISSINGLFYSATERNKQLLRTIHRELGVDYVLLIGKTTSNELHGLGTYERNSLGAMSRVNYSIIQGVVVDARTGDHVGFSSAMRTESVPVLGKAIFSRGLPQDIKESIMSRVGDFSKEGVQEILFELGMVR